MIDLSAYGFERAATTGWGMYRYSRFTNKNYDIVVKTPGNVFDVFKDRELIINEEPLINIVSTIAEIEKDIKGK